MYKCLSIDSAAIHSPGGNLPTDHKARPHSLPANLIAKFHFGQQLAWLVYRGYRNASSCVSKQYQSYLPGSMEPFGNLSVSDSYGPDQDGYDHSAVAGFGTIAGPRAYKSRKNRPCDFCRTRKAACKIAAAPPCALCQSYGRDCTFLERPQKRKRPAPDLQEGKFCPHRLLENGNPRSHSEDGQCNGELPKEIMLSKCVFIANCRVCRISRRRKTTTARYRYSIDVATIIGQCPFWVTAWIATVVRARSCTEWKRASVRSCESR